MLFNSFSFLIFFPVVVLLYYIIPKKVRYLWLLLASYFFYMSWNPTYALLIAFSTVVTFASGWLMERFAKAASVTGADPTAAKKWVVAISFIINMGILIFFKYFDFLLQNFNRVLSVVNMQAVQKPFDVLLPVGISFYTFQALSYTMDVYRGDIPAERNILNTRFSSRFFPSSSQGLLSVPKAC